MAEKIQLQVELESKLKSSREIFSTLKDKKGFEKNPKAEQQVEGLLQQLETFKKVTNPTLKQLSHINSLFNQLSEILLKVAYRTSTASKEFKAIEKKLKNQEDNLKGLREERGKILKTGRVEDGKYQLFTTYQDDVIKQANIKNKKGQQIKTASTFFKKFDSEGNPLENAFLNPTEAKKLYDSLKRTQIENEKRLIELNNEITQYKDAIKNTKDELIAQSKKERFPIAGQIISNQSDFDDMIESNKEVLHNKEDAGKAVSSAESYNLTASINKQQSALSKAFKQFTIYNTVLRITKQALREAVQTIKELDKSLTEQAMVTGMTRQQTYQLVGAYQELALQTGATSKEIASVATEYMKQGKTIEDSLVLTEAAVKAAKVARVSVGDSVNYLTTALNGFRLSAEDAMKVSDKFAAVAAASATDYDELAIALSKVASQANLAGMSIDYTTALLTKGLETTREAPETMGTALKTIIARMRELTDYGETLEGDTDINNVESQLAYVDIALRNTNGELRSTEDVLDELGRKWDTLDKNQQAAVAKALAGTRQQSRLIAMMEDYERVIELQQIAERSAGATAAQAGVYLEGIEASMNKIQVAWEKITTTIADNGIIIGFFNFVGDMLNTTADLMDGWVGQWIILPGLITLVIGALVGLAAKTIVQNNLAKQQLQLEREHQKQSLITRNEEILNQELKKRNIALGDAEYKEAFAVYKVLVAQGKQIAKNNKIKKTGSTSGQVAAGGVEIQEANKSIKSIQQLSNVEQDLIKTNKEYAANLQMINSLNAESNNLMNLSYIGIAAVTAGTQILNVFKSIGLLLNVKKAKQDIVNQALQKRGIELTGKETAAELADIAAQTGLIVSNGVLTTSLWAVVKAQLATLASNPWTIAIAAVAIGAILAMVVVINNLSDSTENAAEQNRALSNEIYKSTQNAQKISEITYQYEKLDNQLIKTKKDLEEMNDLLKSGSELLDTENTNWRNKGMTEKEWYETLDAQSQYVYLLEKETEEEEKAWSNRAKTINNISRHQEMLNKNSEYYAETRAELVSANNAQLYKELDESKEIAQAEKEAIQDIASMLFGEMDGRELFEAYNNGFTKTLMEALNSAEKITTENNEIVSASEVLASDSYSLSEKVEALRNIQKQLSGDALAIFNSVYPDINTFNKLGDSVIQFVDSIGLSIEELDELYDAWEKLQKAGVEISQEVWEGRFENYLETLADTQGDVLAATELVFGDYLDGSEEALNAFVRAYGDLVQIGILNMGQNMEKTKNSINNFYEKALEWGTMSESEKADFIQDNAALFSDGNLLKAFESGNYEDIEAALKDNEALQKQIEQRRKEVEQELLIERAKEGADRNEAYIAQLENYEKYLNDTENLFKASLEVRLEQEKAQLDEYKSYLQDQQKALEESLEKRKNAYEKYFDVINQEEENQEYEAQANLLISNLSKLSSSADAASKKQTKELEKQLEELEKERLKELRERAQEAVLEDMDDQLEEINEKFDKLLESNQALLAAMRGDLDNPTEFVSNLISNKIESGATALDINDYISSLKSTYGNILGNDVDWDAIQVREENNQLFLNVNGQDVVLDTTNEQNLYMAIMKALTEVGLR